MREIADLEWTIHPRDAKVGGGYAVEIRYFPPGIDGEIDVLRSQSVPLLLNLNELRSRGHDPDAYGRYLGMALFGHEDAPSPLYTAYEKVRDAAEREQTRVRLRLRFGSRAQELHDLHWEQLRDPFTGAPLFTGAQLVLSRYLSSPSWKPLRPRPRAAMRALAVIANPPSGERGTLAPIDVARYQQFIIDQLQPIMPVGRIMVAPDELNLSALSAELRHGYDLLYLVAHGRFRDGNAHLWLAHPEGHEHAGQGEWVAGTELIQRMAELEAPPRLVILVSCQSAGTGIEGDDDPLAALGPQLSLRVGIPAVLAMRGNLTFTTAERLLPAFLTALAKTGEADLALAIARGDVRDRHDWGMATLLTRTRRGQIWSDEASLTNPLAPAELELGLRRLEQLVPMHGPGMQSDLARSTEKVHELLRLSAIPAENLVHVVANLDKLTGALLEQSFSQFARSHQPELSAPSCPFRGLYAFGLDDAAFFYGREVLVTRLVGRLKEQRFLAILGESGCGKSSLALAGLAPALRSELPGLAITTLRPSHDPLAQWQASVGQATAVQQLVIIDQFEELFTLCNDQSQRRTFIQRLLGLRQTHYVLVTMRADFWVDCARHVDLISVMQHAHELIAPMTAPELQRAMELQAHEGKLTFEEGLSQVILDDVTDEPGAMPLLQHALQELWKRRYGRFLRLTDYLNIGGVQEAIAQTARSVYSALPEDDRPLARRIFLQLTRVDTTLEADVRRDTRRRVALSQLCGDEPEVGPIRHLIERLADARLIVKRVNAAAGPDAVEVEIAHEALIRHWPDLRAWLNADREQLTFREMLRTSAREWELNGRIADLLVHRGTRLDQAERDLARHAHAVSELERRYLNACREQAKAEQPLKYLDRMGWAIIVHPDEPVSVLQALWPLIDLRMRQMNFTQRDFTFEADESCGAWLARHTNEYQYTWLNHVGSIPPVLLYRHEEPFLDWLARHETGPGEPDLSRLPYYLLIVGKPGPTHADDQVYIPFAFQYLLDVQRGVGRLHFETREAYAQYARSIVASESGYLSVPQRMAYFAPRHELDDFTHRSHTELVLPLITALRNRQSAWNAETWLEAAATRGNLAQLFGLHQNSALLFTAGHGMSLPREDERFREHLGALVTQDWPGIGNVTREHWFASEDLSTDARLLGGMAFLFAPWSAGTPMDNDFDFEHERSRAQIAPHAILARLPQALLSHKQGGMLAVIGHIHVSWNLSFNHGKDKQRTSVIETFVQCLSRLMEGYPVGAALAYFNQRYAELAAILSQQLEASNFKPSGEQATQPDPHELAQHWMRLNDARNYIIIGDPAVRLPPTSPLADDQPRPTLTEIETLIAAESAAKSAASSGDAAL